MKRKAAIRKSTSIYEFLEMKSLARTRIVINTPKTSQIRILYLSGSGSSFDSGSVSGYA